MREDRCARRQDQPRVEPGIGAGDDLGNGPRLPRRPCAGSASRAASGGRSDGGDIAAGWSPAARARGKRCGRRARRSFSRLAIYCGHVAVGRHHHGGRPAHDMVAAEQGVAIERSRGGWRCGPASRPRSASRPSIVDALAVVEHAVGRIGPASNPASSPVPSHRQRRAADRSARRSRVGQRPRGGAVVAVGVGAEDRGDRPPADRRDQRVEMLGQVGPGIDHRDLVLADQIGLGAGDR